MDKNKFFTKTGLWADVQAFFTDLFNMLPGVQTEELTFPVEALVKLLDDHFKGKYNAEVIAHLLKKGFEVTPGNYVFKREDFISDAKNRLEFMV